MPIEASPLIEGDLARPLLWRDGEALSAGGFLARALALAARLPETPHLINLCEDRGRFLLGFCAALLRGQTTLLPPARTPQVVAEIASAYAPAATIDDAAVELALADVQALRMPDVAPAIAGDRIVAIGFTSGSTGTPSAHPKTWRALATGTRLNLGILQPLGRPLNVLATVPAQHMYGMETSVLLPLLGDVAVAVDRPLFPQDLASALARLPAPRLLVTTPVHLRAFVDAGIGYPSPAAIVSATAPLSRELAARAEAAFGAPLIEVFGSTETCVIGHRRTAVDDDWRLHAGLRLESVDDGTRVHARHYGAPVLLQDHVRMTASERFAVQGRCQDMIEIAGKRASVGDITSRLLAIPGVRDAAAIQSPSADGSGVQRVVAFVAAPEVGDGVILDALKRSLDPVFLPRRLIRVERLPRNDTGKLRRDDLVALLAAASDDGA